MNGTTEAALPPLIVYSRRGCHLCELLLGELDALVRGKVPIEVRDVDERPEWQAAYGERVPVVCCDGNEICQYNLDRRAVLDRIASRHG
ncbi:MAG: glutaredoxin family protein [Gammaproteobacteria bacterium]